MNTTSLQMKVETPHIQKLVKSALEHIGFTNNKVIYRPGQPGMALQAEEADANARTKEALLCAIRQLNHAVGELEAELHKVEYGYDIAVF